MLSISPKSAGSSIFSKSPPAPPTVTLAVSNPLPLDFDAGINSSAAWTEHLEREGSSLSDEEEEEKDNERDQEESRPARALYAFEGKAEFREITVEAGAQIQVLKEELQDGWSLVRHERDVGLLPRTYYIFTAEFAKSPTLEDPPGHIGSDDHTPRGSPRSSLSHDEPLVPQNTGEWIRALPSFRRSLLGGKSLNRFSNFVTSGAEEFVLKGSNVLDAAAVSHERVPTTSVHRRFATDTTIRAEIGGESDEHYVGPGPTWKTKVPPFRILVHSPVKVSSSITGAYIVYSVTSLFDTPKETYEEDDEEEMRATDGDGDGDATTTRVTVPRRFSHFVALHAALVRRLPGLALPPLPDKQYAGRFSADFVEARRGDLERYLSRLVRHPVVRYAEILMFFLSCENDVEWKKLLPKHLALPPAGPAFYARVYHPSFNLDAEDAREAVNRFETHTRAVGKGVQSLRSVFTRVREARIEMSKAERLLSFALLSLITAKPMDATPAPGTTEEEGSLPQGHAALGATNEQGAWCWRENCDECFQLTRALQKTADTLQNVADLYDNHARQTQLATHEAMKGVAHPASTYAAVVETHRATLSRYAEGPKFAQDDEDVSSRCETVLNTTMAEMDTYHTQKVEDFRELAAEHLDGEINFYEQVLHRLRTAREAYDTTNRDSSGDLQRIQPSMYERELAGPHTPRAPLPQPSPHVFDAAPMRPVTMALQDGVGALLGATSAGRASVLGLGRLWA